MSTRKTIVVHGLLAAVPLAIIGYLYAQMAGMWISSQTMPRAGANGAVAVATSISASEVTSAIAWRLPFTMAIFGFVFVAMGEGAKAVWRNKEIRAENEGRVQLDVTTELETQRILLAQEAEETIAIHPPAEADMNDSLFDVEEMATAGSMGASNLHN